MQRWLRLFSIASLLFVVPLTGCETRRIWIELPSFGDGNVDGVWLWRLTESGEYERQCNIPLGDVEVVDAREAVFYDQQCGDDLPGLQLHAAIERSSTDPETVMLGLWYMRYEDPGVYKISSYGAAGESALSDTTLDL